MTAYRDRHDAGERLAAELTDLAGRDDVVVLGLPRGGVVVAARVAQALRAPLGVIAVCKLGVPGRQELAMGAVASDGIGYLDIATVAGLRIPERAVVRERIRARNEARRRASAFRAPGNGGGVDVEGRTAVLVDDGIATGATMRAAIASVRRAGAERVVVAVPVAAPATCAALERDVDELVCPLRPEPFGSVGSWYRDFSQTSDDEVRSLLGSS